MATSNIQVGSIIEINLAEISIVSGGLLQQKALPVTERLHARCFGLGITLIAVGVTSGFVALSNKVKEPVYYYIGAAIATGLGLICFCGSFLVPCRCK